MDRPSFVKTHCILELSQKVSLNYTSFIVALNFEKLILHSGGSDNLEYIMLAEINFERLVLMPKVDVILDEQVYEDVPGFESLRQDFT